MADLTRGGQVIACWRRYEVHVEVQVYLRGWIYRTITPVAPLSGTCFSPERIAETQYNLTLAQAPRHVDVHAGLAMSLGDDCYNFAKTVPRRPLDGMVLPQHTIFHVYWRNELRALGARQTALLRSLLATQDRDTTSVVLWTNTDPTSMLSSNPELVALRALYGEQRFVVRAVDKAALAKGTPIAGSARLDVADEKAWLDGDIVRLLVLWAHGGMWVDMDTILTGRDLRVLTESEWVTQWDCYGSYRQSLRFLAVRLVRSMNLVQTKCISHSTAR